MKNKDSGTESLSVLGREGGEASVHFVMTGRAILNRWSGDYIEYSSRNIMILLKTRRDGWNPEPLISKHPFMSLQLINNC